ncbi:MAG: hypothetical protein H6Q54_1033 [Deltaproteobacteria bacterium]|nr:hypothetical protein [Deltaproteobacteria bacterium]
MATKSKPAAKPAAKAAKKPAAKAKPAAKPAPKASAKPAAKAAKKPVVPKGSKYTCGVCGMVVSVDTACGCVETCDLICCAKPMKLKKA